MIVGHSERRADHGERSSDVQAKALAAHRAGLTAIVCIGETAGERKAGLTLAVVARQLGASLPERANAADTVDRLRAGVGHRHGADAVGGRRRGGARPSCAARSRSDTARRAAACESSTAGR